MILKLNYICCTFQVDHFGGLGLFPESRIFALTAAKLSSDKVCGLVRTLVEVLITRNEFKTSVFN